MDVSFIMSDYKFNYRVATIIRNDYKILLHKNKNDIFYAIPGGRVKIGEDSIKTLKREFLEEIGAKIKVDRMIGVVENFFTYNNKEYHELMLIYESSFEKDEGFYDKKIVKGIENDGKIEFVWKSIAEIKELDLRPKKLKDLLIDNNMKDFVHIIDKS